MDNLRLWHKFLQTIRSEISPANFKTYFLKTLLKSVGDDKITLSVPSAFIVETLDRDYKKLIEDIFEKLLGKKPTVEFVVKEFEQVPEENREDFFQAPQSSTTSSLNPKYTLENFVVGLSNNVAYAAAQAVVQNPGISYNPLFFYGGTGVGKTHLMVGIGNAILTKKPHLKIIYCSSEKFTNDYVAAIQTRKMGEFRAKYRATGLLLVDDVQFFSGRDQTQEEFFHTFNELTTKNSQIVLTSDRPPNEMPKLEDRLKSRFQGGLMVDIQPPGIDTRVAILKAKCAERGESLPEECLNLIASSVETNARELEGTLIRILQTLKTQNLPPTEEVIRSYLGQKPITPLSLNHKQVLSGLCEYFNIKMSDLTGPKRVKELVLPRHLAMHILSEELNLTVERIGEILGGRDHTTVMHGRDKIKHLITTDREMQRIMIEVKQTLSTPQT
ncbi:MAG: chromosomal replication initiator protein [Microgenomates group bacterium Gr01-1014_7]|nr:MAG: chromosomal replication initiator protein [Microgenomates group bacterium Gr01-1014_7]